MKSFADSRPVTPAVRRSRSIVPQVPDRWLAFLFLVPALIALAAVMAYPLAYSFWISLHRYNLLDPSRYIGLHNYQRIWEDDKVWNSFKVTFIFSIPVLLINLVLGFSLALLIHHKARAKALW